MSYYYNYFIGYKSHGKIYPLGPYNSLGRLRAVRNVSRSFTSDLHEDMLCIEEDDISEELRKEFEYTDWNGEKKVNVKYMPISELPHDSFIKTGYFLIEDVKQYEETGDAFDLFYENISPTVYVAMLETELKFGKSAKKKDAAGTTYQPHSASDYMYYAYPNYKSKEYDAFLIRTFAESLYSYSGLPEDAELVALETEG